MFFDEEDIRNAVICGAALLHNIVEKEGSLRYPSSAEYTDAVKLFMESYLLIKEIDGKKQ